MARLFPAALACGVVVGIAGAVQGWRAPELAFKIVDTVAAVSAILVGVSLAIVAILAAPTPIPSADRRSSAADIARQNDLDLVGQQLFVFFGFFFCLLSSVGLKYVGGISGVNWMGAWERAAGAIFLGSLCYSLVLALYLPFLLRGIVSARRSYN